MKNLEKLKAAADAAWDAYEAAYWDAYDGAWDAADGAEPDDWAAADAAWDAYEAAYDAWFTATQGG